MQTLHELLNLIKEADDDTDTETEAPEKDEPTDEPKKEKSIDVNTYAYALEDMKDALPTKHGKAMAALWSKPGKLLWHGMPLFTTDGKHHEYAIHGEGFDKIEEACLEEVSNLTLEEEIDVDGVGEFEDDTFNIQWEVTFDPKDHTKMEWVGYHKEQDAFIIGYDLWADSSTEEAFNQAFDKEFEHVTGQDHDLKDDDEDDHNKIYNAAWKKYQSGQYGFFGVVFGVKYKNGGLVAKVLTPFTHSGGFHRGSYPLLKEDAMWPNLFVPD
jgi:hypothetical protein